MKKGVYAQMKEWAKTLQEIHHAPTEDYQSILHHKRLIICDENNMRGKGFAEDGQNLLWIF